MSANIGIRKISFARSDTDLNRCFPVMAELRTDLVQTDFVRRAKRQKELCGFEIVFIEDEAEVKAVAGIRIGEWLASGRYLEIEDLVASSTARSEGFGGELFNWIADFAREQQCAQLRLVSAVSRFDAHRFYLQRRMNIEAHYFSLTL